MSQKLLQRVQFTKEQQQARKHLMKRHQRVQSQDSQILLMKAEAVVSHRDWFYALPQVIKLRKHEQNIVWGFEKEDIAKIYERSVGTLESWLKPSWRKKQQARIDKQLAKLKPSPSPSPEPVKDDRPPDLSSQSALPSQQGSASTSAKPSPSPSAKDESSELSFPMEDSPEPPVEEQLQVAEKEIARLRGVLREYMDENEKLEAELKKKMAQGDGESTKEKDLQIEKLEKRLKKLDVEWGRAIHERDWIKKEFENYKKEVAPRMMGLNDVRGEVYQDLREKHNALVQKHNELIDEFNEEHERGSAYKRRLKNAGESVSSSEDEASEEAS